MTHDVGLRELAEKTSPLPWSYDADRQTILDANGKDVGWLSSAHDDVMAIHAVNTQKELIEALADLVENKCSKHCDWDAARAALLRAGRETK